MKFQVYILMAIVALAFAAEPEQESEDTRDSRYVLNGGFLGNYRGVGYPNYFGGYRGYGINNFYGGSYGAYRNYGAYNPWGGYRGYHGYGGYLG